jgi:hypothetical protein
MGSLNVCSGESSTRTLFMRVMETFDDDDDDDYTLAFSLYYISFYDLLLSALDAEISSYTHISIRYITHTE